ncbi:MAG TPA: hypothetical protein VN931_12015, partial [Fibrobacteria bacterium]|nr:hypothetical protein [Fibrobacteria bacterium]
MPFDLRGLGSSSSNKDGRGVLRAGRVPVCAAGPVERRGSGIGSWCATDDFPNQASVSEGRSLAEAITLGAGWANQSSTGLVDLGSTAGVLGAAVEEGAGTGVGWRFDDPNQSSEGLAGFDSRTGALGGDVGEGVGTGVDWRFDDPNQSSAGLAGFGSTTGAFGGDVGEGAGTG